MSGTYILKEGKSDECPDGQFSFLDGAFFVGSSLRIDEIGKGEKNFPASDQSSCDLVTQADFKDNKLVYKRRERCKKVIVTQASYVFHFDQDKSFIKMSYRGEITTSGDKKNYKFDCVYSSL